VWRFPPVRALACPAAMRTRLLILLSALVLGLAACGGDDNDDGTTGTNESAQAQTETTGNETESTETTPAEDDAAESGGSSDIKASTSKDLSKKPRIPKQTADAPTTLVVQDIVKGKGPAAKPGDVVSVQYVGVRYRDNQQFDASWERGQPFTFPLGAGQVIQGWDQGVAGMKVGGRRQLVIPPDLAYGDQGAGADIGPNETLIFVVDLEKIGS
jgi:peptidylprolyl isomerase